MTKLTIAYAPDDGYTNMTVVSMVSAIENNKDCEIEFVLLYSNLSDVSIKKYKSVEEKFNCKLRFIEMNESDFDGLPLSKWVTVQAWFRIKIPDLCPDLDRVLYLDCDTMINGSIRELFEMDLDNNYVAAVKDVWNVQRNIKRLGMKSDSYFNSGMLLMNCNLFRNDNIFEKLKEYSIANKKIIKFCDQDTLNKVIDERKINLHQKFNFMDTWWGNYYVEYEADDLRNYNEAKQNPVIVHLTGPKPTAKGCKNIMTEKWWEYAKLTDIYQELEERYQESSEPKKKIKFLSKIFNIKNQYRYKDKWKVVTLLGIKMKFRLERANKIFVVFNTAFIGDILLNNTLVQNIKYFYPESRVVFVTQPQFKDVALYQKDVDEVVVFDKKKDSNPFGFFKFVKNFPYKNIFASFVLYSNDRNLILSKLLGAEHIMTEPAGLLTKIIPTKEKYKRNVYKHKKDISTGLIESLTGKAILDLPIIYDAPVDEYKGLEKNKEYICITATSKYKPKDMPIDVAVELINKLNMLGKTPVILGAGPVARDFVSELKNNGCSDYIDLNDKTNFVELANVLRISKALISVDTGTMHMGNALNVPTVALFYSWGKEMWAPQDGLYKAVTLYDKPNANDILQVLEELI